MYVSGMRAPFSKYPPGLPSLIAIPPNRTHPQFVRSTKSNLSSTRNVPPPQPAQPATHMQFEVRH
jgi:hypothetical protein